MPDTAALKIININIDSIQAAEEDCNTNISAMLGNQTQHRKCLWWRRNAQTQRLIPKSTETVQMAIMLTQM